MTIGEKLLKPRAMVDGLGAPVGRDPKDIAADYETALRELLSAG